eukprot:TRINITY_DN9839_c0_g2_i1.p1 TRINITY_DN9839_c0_g2~~TRINITY_DN9839_c0_g2_i1.p1  ORF type:complete len:443 (-),score=104.73 TRINITY_DN9839_c0_g2_i1:24-1352(-)
MLRLLNNLLLSCEMKDECAKRGHPGTRSLSPYSEREQRDQVERWWPMDSQWQPQQPPPDQLPAHETRWARAPQAARAQQQQPAHGFPQQPMSGYGDPAWLARCETREPHCPEVEARRNQVLGYPGGAPPVAAATAPPPSSGLAHAPTNGLAACSSAASASAPPPRQAAPGPWSPTSAAGPAALAEDMQAAPAKAQLPPPPPPPPPSRPRRQNPQQPETPSPSRGTPAGSAALGFGADVASSPAALAGDAVGSAGASTPPAPPPAMAPLPASPLSPQSSVAAPPPPPQARATASSAAPPPAAAAAAASPSAAQRECAAAGAPALRHHSPGRNAEARRPQGAEAYERKAAMQGEAVRAAAAAAASGTSRDANAQVATPLRGAHVRPGNAAPEALMGQPPWAGASPHGAPAWSPPASAAAPAGGLWGAMQGTPQAAWGMPQSGRR